MSQLPQARYNRVDTNDVDYRVRGALSIDARNQTEYGTLRSYFRIGVEQTTPADGIGGVRVLGPRLHPVRRLHGRQGAVVLRYRYVWWRLQLPQRAHGVGHRRVGLERLGLHRPVRQRLLRDVVVGRPRTGRGR